MLIFLATLLVIALLMLCSFYFYQENKHKRDQQQTKKSLVARVEKFKLRFKDSINPITASGDLSQQESDALFRVANYYFVYQSMSLENVDRYEQQLGSLLNLIESSVLSELGANELDEQPANSLVKFVHSLPSRVEGFGPSFYNNDLPVLMQKLSEADIEDEAESEALILDDAHSL